mmetsp:Transcript_19457/g.61748  ORF Transcript_19457/g.61748 Transcript_19457/m.61748 type:complete len:385 (+) Transcript_19457:77-1231(+)
MPRAMARLLAASCGLLLPQRLVAGMDDTRWDDAAALIQTDTRFEPLSLHVSPSVTALAATRRMHVISQITSEMDKYLGKQAMEDVFGDSEVPSFDASSIIKSLPSMMDSLRDDNFVRSFIEFEDNVQQASNHFVSLAQNQMASLLGSINSTLLKQSSPTDELRLTIAKFLDNWVHHVLASYPEELAKHATQFSKQVGEDHSLSKDFADLFLPMFKNASHKITTRLIPGADSQHIRSTGRMMFEDVLANESADRFCDMVGMIVKNATVADKDATKVLKMLNASKKLAVPMIGQYMSKSLPDDAPTEDTEVPVRMMLMVNYEVDMMYSMMDAFRQNMNDVSSGLSPLIYQGMHCVSSGAATVLSSAGLGAAMLAVAASFWHSLSLL